VRGQGCKALTAVAGGAKVPKMPKVFVSYATDQRRRTTDPSASPGRPSSAVACYGGWNGGQANDK